jgi:hypothetical protein
MWSPSKALSPAEISSLLDSPPASQLGSRHSPGFLLRGGSDPMLSSASRPSHSKDSSSSKSVLQPFFDEQEASLHLLEHQPDPWDYQENHERVWLKKREIWKSARARVRGVGRSGEGGEKVQGEGGSGGRSKSLPVNLGLSKGPLPLPARRPGKKIKTTTPILNSRGSSPPQPRPPANSPSANPDPTIRALPTYHSNTVQSLAFLAQRIHKKASGDTIRLLPSLEELSSENNWNRSLYARVPWSPQEGYFLSPLPLEHLRKALDESSPLLQYFHPTSTTYKVGDRGFTKVELMGRVEGPGAPVQVDGNLEVTLPSLSPSLSQPTHLVLSLS